MLKSSKRVAEMALEEIDVLYYVEHKDRELAIAESLATNLNHEYGLNVVVVSQIFDATISIFKYLPKIVVTPTTAFSIGSPSWMFYQLYGKQIQYLSLNYEQLLGSWESSSKMVFSEITKEYQHHFAWGDGFVDVLVNQKVLRKNIQITGRPLSTLIEKEYSIKSWLHTKNPNEETVKMDYFNIQEILFNLYNQK